MIFLYVGKQTSALQFSESNNNNTIIIKEVQIYPNVNVISYITTMQQGESKLRRRLFTQPHATARGG